MWQWYRWLFSGDCIFYDGVNDDSLADSSGSDDNDCGQCKSKSDCSKDATDDDNSNDGGPNNNDGIDTNDDGGGDGDNSDNENNDSIDGD